MENFRLQEYVNFDPKEPFSAWWVYIKTPLMFTEAELCSENEYIVDEEH